jgi:2-keto-3-deoxy-galactonokinase
MDCACGRGRRARHALSAVEPGRSDAALAGLAAPAPATVFVVGERIVPHPAVPRGLDEACRKLARAAGVKLLGIDFAPGIDGRWRCTGASVMPDLMRGGEAVADALAQAFRA